MARISAETADAVKASMTVHTRYTVRAKEFHDGYELVAHELVEYKDLRRYFGWTAGLGWNEISKPSWWDDHDLPMFSEDDFSEDQIGAAIDFINN